MLTKDILFYVMMGIEGLLLIPFLLNYKLLDKAGKCIFYYLIVSIIFAFGSKLFTQLLGHNLWFFSIMHLVQFIVLSMFYYLIIKKVFLKQLIKLLLVPATAICLLDFFKLEGMYAFNSIFASIRTVVLLSYGVIYFLQTLFDEDLVKRSVFINNLPNFWFNAGLFIYHCAAFLFSLTYNFFLQHSLNKNNARGILALTFFAGIIQLILFYIGLMKAKKQRT